MANDDDVAGGGSEEPELVPRPPESTDLAALCEQLNRLEALYVVIGGFAVIHSGFPRFTGDLDFLIATDLENEAKVYEALRSLPDRAVDQLAPGEVAKYSVIRVADEIVVDLMGSACGIEYAEAAQDVVMREVHGVAIPFASPRLLWRMKATTHREKDAADLVFLRRYFESQGETPPE